MASLRKSQAVTNGDAMTRLLYAILKQKCLKDIDWNQVAHDPILAQEITNGHAARMRYSRFKKQMDGTTGVRRERNTNPNRKKVEKKTKGRRPKQENGKDTRGDVGVKQEATPDALPGDMDYTEAEEMSTPQVPVIKTEPGLDTHAMFSPSPTPGYDGGSESRNFNEQGLLRSGYELTSSISPPPQMPRYQPTNFGMGNLDTSGSVPDPYIDVWQPKLGHHPLFGSNLGGVEPIVKQEDRWDDSYHH